MISNRCKHCQSVGVEEERGWKGGPNDADNPDPFSLRFPSPSSCLQFSYINPAPRPCLSISGKEIAVKSAGLPPLNQMLLAPANLRILPLDQMTADDYLEDIYKQAPTEPEARKHWRRENFERVAVSPELVLSGVSTDETLHRFMDLPKLFDVLKNRHLVLPRLKELMEGDPFECRAKRTYDHLDRASLELRARQLKEYAPESVRYPPRILPPPSLYSPPTFDSDIEQMTLETLKDAVWYLERERLQWDLVCSCWHRGTVESDAMWKIYAPQLGVSISSSAARMKSGMRMIVPKILAGRARLNLAAVHYDDTAECGNLEPWLIKRKAFAHENEIRLYCDGPYRRGSNFDLEVDLSIFIEEIVITPFAAAWQFPGIKGAIEALLKEAGAGQITVRQSKHMLAPEIGWPPEIKARREGRRF